MMTFIAKKSDGSKVAILEFEAGFNGKLNPDYVAKYCTCTHGTQNTSEIPDWNTAKGCA
jgi:hypothetical protein